MVVANKSANRAIKDERVRRNHSSELEDLLCLLGNNCGSDDCFYRISNFELFEEEGQDRKHGGYYCSNGRKYCGNGGPCRGRA